MGRLTDMHEKVDVLRENTSVSTEFDMETDTGTVLEPKTETDTPVNRMSESIRGSIRRWITRDRCEEKDDK